ncbi:hypothetical protein ABZP36_015555 [Zizania latifolia]
MAVERHEHNSKDARGWRRERAISGVTRSMRTVVRSSEGDDEEEARAHDDGDKARAHTVVATGEETRAWWREAVLAYDRPRPLRRCLHSLAAADYAGDRIVLLVLVDHPPPNTSREILAEADTPSGLMGRNSCITAPSTQGYRRSGSRPGGPAPTMSLPSSSRMTSRYRRSTTTSSSDIVGFHIVEIGNGDDCWPQLMLTLTEHKSTHTHSSTWFARKEEQMKHKLVRTSPHRSLTPSSSSPSSSSLIRTHKSQLAATVFTSEQLVIEPHTQVTARLRHVHVLSRAIRAPGQADNDISDVIHNMQTAFGDRPEVLAMVIKLSQSFESLYKAENQRMAFPLATHLTIIVSIHFASLTFQVALLCLVLSPMSPWAIGLHPILATGMLFGVKGIGLGDENLIDLPPRGDRLTSSNARNWSSEG